MTPARPPFPFFVGCGRSGTTLVRAIFDAHPKLAVPDESYFPVSFWLRRRRYEKAGAVSVDRFCSDLAADGSFGRWGVPVADVEAELLSCPPAGLADAFRAAYTVYARAHGKQRYADKTPVFVRHIPMLAAMFPEAVFVHVVRDGRDVALSRIATEWSTDRSDSEALIWSAAVAAGRRAGDRLGDRRYRELRYEDLLDDPEAVVRGVCGFIDLDYDPQMLAYHESSAGLVAALPHPQEHGNVVRAPMRTRDWRSEMDAADLALFEAIAGRALSEMGYDLGTTHIGGRVRARAVALRARWRIGRAGRSLRHHAWRVLRSR